MRAYNFKSASLRKGNAQEYIQPLRDICMIYIHIWTTSSLRFMNYVLRKR